MSRIAVALLMCLTTGCARRAHRAVEENPAPPPPPAEQQPAAVAPEAERLPPGLRFDVQPPDADITIDDKSYGAAGDLGHVPLPPGIYRVSIRAKGHTTWRAEVSVGDSTEVLKVALSPRS